MELDQLRQLDAIEREGTISAAARELHLSQSALSRSVRRLEAELGMELFDRDGRRVRLNEAGAVAVDWARQILRDERLMRDAVGEAAHRARALRVGTVAPAPLWRLTGLMVEHLPGETLTSETLDGREVLRGVTDGSLDLGITLAGEVPPNLRACELLRESLSVTLPPSHPLASRSSLPLARLDGETFLMFSDVGFWRGVVERALPHSQIIEQADRVVFGQLARSTPHCTFVTDAPYMEGEVEAGRVVVPLEDADAHAVFWLVARRDAGGLAARLFDVARVAAQGGRAAS